MREVLRNNGLLLALFALFAVCLVGQGAAGLQAYNQDQLAHGQPAVALIDYVASGHFIEAVFENWESEFLQMAALIVLTALLRQKGSIESKKLEGKEPVDADPRHARHDPSAPWPVRRGGLALRLYEHSLSIALVLLFAISFVLHAFGGAREFNQEQLEHGGMSLSVLAYIGTSRFWFESFQNWQSEFLSVGVLTVLTIFLRQRGSSQSKPVAHPHHETGHAEEGPPAAKRSRRRRKGRRAPSAR